MDTEIPNGTGVEGGGVDGGFVDGGGGVDGGLVVGGVFGGVVDGGGVVGGFVDGGVVGDEVVGDDETGVDAGGAGGGAVVFPGSFDVVRLDDGASGALVLPGADGFDCTADAGLDADPDLVDLDEERPVFPGSVPDAGPGGLSVDCGCGTSELAPPRPWCDRDGCWAAGRVASGPAT